MNDGYKEVRIGPKSIEIPKEWSIKNLNKIITRLTNGISKKQNSNNSGIPVTRIETISDGEINYDKVGYVNVKNKDEIKDYKLEEGDVLFSHINSVPHIGKTAQYWGEETLYHGMNLILIRFANSEINEKYGYYFLNSEFANSFYKSFCKQAVNQASLNQKEIGLLKVPLPPPSAQRRIAEILSTVDDAIQKTDKVIEKAEKLKKGLMQDLLTKGIGHDDFKEVQVGPRKIQMPSDWDLVRLGDEKYSELTTGGTPSTKKEEYWDGQIPWMVSGEIHDKYINEVEGRITNRGMEESRAEYIPKHSILVALNGQGKTKGKVAINLKKLTVNQSIAAYVLNKDEFEPYFLLHYFTHQYKRIRTLAGEGRSGLNLTLLSNVYVPKPLLEEQKNISKPISLIDEKIEKEKKLKSKLQNLKKGLMQDLLTGKVRMNDLKIGDKNV